MVQWGGSAPSPQGAHSGVHRWPRPAQGAPTGRGRGTDRDARHPLPVSRAAPSCCVPSPSEMVGRLGQIGGGLRAGAAQPKSFQDELRVPEAPRHLPLHKGPRRSGRGGVETSLPALSPHPPELPAPDRERLLTPFPQWRSERVRDAERGRTRAGAQGWGGRVGVGVAG